MSYETMKNKYKDYKLVEKRVWKYRTTCRLES